MARLPLKTKRTPKGKIRGRPRKNADDDIQDMPKGRPGRPKTTLDIVKDAGAKRNVGQPGAAKRLGDPSLTGADLDKDINQRRTRIYRLTNKLRAKAP